MQKCSRWIAVAAALGIVLASGSATAIECNQWNRIPQASKAQTVEQLVGQKLTSNTGQKYTSPDRVAIRRCMKPQVPLIVEDFDGICAEGMRASMNALDQRFMSYFLSCIN